MKKTALSLLLVVVLGYPAASYWLGQRAQSAIQDQLDLVAAQYGPRFEREDVSRGIFTSRYRYAVTVPPLGQDGTDSKRLDFDLLAEVSHGPLPLAGGTFKPALAVVEVRLEPGQAAAASFKEFLDDFPELRQTRLRAVFGYGGDCRADLAVPASRHPLRGRNGAAVDVNWGGATAQVVVGAKAATITGSLDMPLLAVGAKDSALTVRNLAMRSEATLHGQALYLGTSNAAVAAIQFRDPGQAGLDITNLTLEGVSRRRESLVEGNLTLRGQLAVGNSPQNLACDLGIGVRNLDFAALDALLDDWRRIGLAPQSPQVQADQFEAAFTRHAPALFAHKPVLTLDGPRLGLPSGNLAVTASLGYDGTGALPTDPAALLGRCTATAKVTAARPALREILDLAGRIAPKMDAPALQALVDVVLNDLIAQGFVNQDKNTLATTADWNGKLLTINGKLLPLAP